MQVEPKPTSPLQLQVENKKLILQFSAKSDCAIYDVCGMDGRILVTGEVSKNFDTVIDMTSYQDGRYNLFIMDGDILHKELFEL